MAPGIWHRINVAMNVFSILSFYDAFYQCSDSRREFPQQSVGPLDDKLRSATSTMYSSRPTSNRRTCYRESGRQPGSYGTRSTAVEKQSTDLPTREKGRVQLPKIAVAAIAVGFFVGALTLIAAVRHVEYVLAAILPVAAALTILRRHAWGGYRFALFETAQSLLVPALLLQSGNIQRAQIAAAVIGGLVLSFLFFFGGTSLEPGRGGERIAMAGGSASRQHLLYRCSLCGHTSCLRAVWRTRC